VVSTTPNIKKEYMKSIAAGIWILLTALLLQGEQHSNTGPHLEVGLLLLVSTILVLVGVVNDDNKPPKNTQP
jgi:hypothetical protein